MPLHLRHMESIRHWCIFGRFFLVLLFAQLAIAQEKEYKPVQIGIPVLVDGELSEPVWKEIRKTGDFLMNFPRSDKPSDKSVQTEVQVAYDNNNLYISATCFTSNPNSVFTLKRDNPLFWNGDVFGVVLDPLNTKNSGYIFGVNPKSVQADATLGNRNILKETDLLGAINYSWNSQWQAAVKIYEDKWTLEMAIPFRVLRYSNKGNWGINFFRRDVSTNSYHTWSFVPVEYQEMNLDNLGNLVWPSVLRAKKRIGAISPYVLGKYEKDFESENSQSNLGVKAGLDGKIAITQGIDFDITLNSDFSQVEVDQQVTNLSTVNIRFPEQRLFFQENSDLFDNFGIPPMQPFYSRRIGLDEDGNTLPIIFGARLSGAINKDLRISLMNVLTDQSSVANGINYTSLAAHHRIFGKVFLKGYFHNLQDVKVAGKRKKEFNRLGGLEMDFRSTDGKWRSSLGYGLSINPDIEGKNGFYKTELGYNDRNISFFTNVAGVGNEYINEIGFIPRMFHRDAENDTIYRRGFDHFFTTMGYNIYPKEKNINSHRIGVRNVYSITKDGTTFRNEWIPSYRLSWKNSSELNFSYSFLQPRLLYPFAFTDSEPLPSGKYHYNFAELSYRSDNRKKIVFEAGVQSGGFFNGRRNQAKLGLDYRVQPWGVFSINTEYNDIRLPEPYGKEEFILLGSKVELNFSKSWFWTTFFQYNTQRDNFNFNSRIQWQINSLSNLYIVYTDNYAIEIWKKKNSALVVKLNYWLDI